jgi:hypothetical protein
MIFAIYRGSNKKLDKDDTGAEISFEPSRFEFV